MKVYLSYTLTAILSSLLIMFYLGVSAGFASYTPIIALLGSALLFTVAAPLFVFYKRVGLIVGLVGCLLILPYSIMFLNKLIFEYNGRFHWGFILIILPSTLTLISTYLTIKDLFFKNYFQKGVPVNILVKVLLTGTPLIVFILYLLFFGKYWSWEMFNI
jgi:hypothetical protein